MKERISQLINILGIKKKEFAENIYVSSGNLSDWLKGKTEPSAKVLSRICEKYQVNLNWLLTGQGPIFLSEREQMPQVNEHSPEYLSKEKEIIKLKQEIERLKAEIKKIDISDEKDAHNLEALKGRIHQLELENSQLSGQVRILKELLNKKLGLNGA